MINLYRVKRTQLQMLNDRGYDISRESPTFGEGKTINDFEREYREDAEQEKVEFIQALSNPYQQKGNPNEIVYVFYPTLPPTAKYVKKQHLMKLYSILTLQKDIKHVIIISPFPVSPKSRYKQLTSMPSIRFEYFLYSELSYNPTQHVLVPPHRLLNLEERNRVLREEQVDITKLPWISVQDPIARYFGALPNQVIEIRRTSPLADVMVKESIVYRVVRDIPLKRKEII